MHGTVTQIARQKNDASRASIFLDGTFAFGVDEQTIEKFRLRKGDAISEERYREILDFDGWIEAKRVAIRYIDHRARSEKEIRERLKRDDFDDGVIARVVAFLREQLLLDDEKWAIAFTHDKLRKKSISNGVLAKELRAKGVDPRTIEETLLAADLEEPEFDRALKAAQKKWALLARQDESDLKRRQRLIAFLAGRGFGFGIARDVIKQLTGEAPLED